MNNVEHYSKLTGEELSSEVVDSLVLEDIRNKNSKLYLKLKECPLDLNVDEIEQIKKHRGDRNYSKVNLKYSKGFFMSSQSEEGIYEKLNELTIYLLHMCGYRMNKDGLLKYKNGRAIREFTDLRDYFNLSRYKWNVVSKDIEKYALIKEQMHDDVSYLVINPLYMKPCGFKLSIIMAKAFAVEILPNISDFINYIEDEEVFLTLKSYMTQEDIYMLDFKFNPNKHYLVSKGSIPRCGIYLLYKNHKIVYIGKSFTSINARVSLHKKDKDFDDVKSIEFKQVGNINLYEPYLIQKFKPTYNKDFLQLTEISLPKIKGI